MSSAADHAARCSCPTSAASTTRSRPGSARSPSSAARPRRSPARTSTAPSTSRSRCSRPSWPGPRTPGCGCGPTSRCASATRGRGRCRWSRWSTVAHRLMDLGADQLSLGDTIGTGTTGHVSRLLDALDASGIGPDRIGVHFHDTYGQALANTHDRAAPRRHGRRRLHRRARRLPLRQERDRQPRDRGPRLGARRGRRGDRGRPRASSSRRASGWPATSAALRRPEWCAPSRAATERRPAQPCDGAGDAVDRQRAAGAL